MLRRRSERDIMKSPLNIYEVHLAVGSATETNLKESLAKMAPGLVPAIRSPLNEAPITRMTTSPMSL